MQEPHHSPKYYRGSALAWSRSSLIFYNIKCLLVLYPFLRQSHTSMISTIVVLGYSFTKLLLYLIWWQDNASAYSNVHDLTLFQSSKLVLNLYQIGEYEDYKRNQWLENVASLFFIQMKTENPSNIFLNNNKSKLWQDSIYVEISLPFTLTEPTSPVRDVTDRGPTLHALRVSD